MFRIVLYQPEIPSNTGNIGRLCVGASAELHLIKPMRFMINDKYLKRAGLDYWDKLDLHVHEDLDEMRSLYPGSGMWYCTTKAATRYTEVEYQPGDIFVFGPESKGIPEEILRANAGKAITIPMNEHIRSINLSNSAAIILYEALRQTGFRECGNAKRRIIC